MNEERRVLDDKAGIWEFDLPGKPLTKKNHQCIHRYPNGRPFISQNDKYKVYEREMAWYVPKLHIDFPVNLEGVFYMPTKGRVDLVNLLEGLCDILVRGEAVADDNWKIVYRVDGSRVEYDKEHPHVHVKLRRLGKGELPNAR